MPTRESAPIGAPCWVDLMTSDTDRSRAFYGELFGWTSEGPTERFDGYFNFSKDGAPVAGCMTNRSDPPMPDVWSVYLTTDDVTKTVEATAANGGQVYVEPMAVDDLGTMAVLADASGAAIGTWQPGTFAGLQTVAETGFPAWFELQTREHDAAVGFYRDVFRVETQPAGDTPDFRYTLLVHGDDQLAGIMDATSFLPEGVPNHWSVYFAVDDTDAILAKVVELGGSVAAPGEDTPYGRLATAVDPNGARFKVVGPNAAG